MKTTATLILSLVLGVLTVAQDAAAPDWFKKLDRNGDGKLPSLAELTALLIWGQI